MAVSPIPFRTAPARQPALTEQGVMRDFASQHETRLRYDHDRGRWLVWDQHFWRPDRRKKAFWDTLEHCHALGMKKAESASFANAVEGMARAHSALSTAAHDWNPNPTLVACPDGVIDLETGDIRPGQASDMIDRCLAVSPDNSPFSQPWYDFLMTMFAGDVAMHDFLQRWCGYCLSGIISEHKFLFLHGTGANGKGTLLNTLQQIWGDLVAIASIDVFLESQNDRHPTELARLHGTHLVLVHETREGKRWDEAKIKAMTGGDRITARFMRRDEFEFDPRFKPMFAGNHRPHLRTVDEAIRRRLLLLPCTVTIPAQQRDPLLLEKLRAEHPHILRWAIEGFALWRRLGLRPPPAVTSATEEYLSHQDDLQLWIGERTQAVAYKETSSKILYFDWMVWKKDRGELPGSQRSFNDRMVDKGFPRVIKKTGIVFENIDLVTPTSATTASGAPAYASANAIPC